MTRTDISTAAAIIARDAVDMADENGAADARSEACFNLDDERMVRGHLSRILHLQGGDNAITDLAATVRRLLAADDITPVRDAAIAIIRAA